jgi:hypothetical protein
MKSIDRNTYYLIVLDSIKYDFITQLIALFNLTISLDTLFYNIQNNFLYLLATTILKNSSGFLLFVCFYYKIL